MQHLMPWAASFAASAYAAVYAALVSFADPWPAWLLTAVWKGAALLAAAWLVAGVVRSAAMRHLVWAFALGFLLLLPLLAAVLPSLDLPAPARTAATAKVGPLSEVAGPAGGAHAARDLPARPVAARLTVDPAPPATRPAKVASEAGVPLPAAVPAREEATSSTVSWSTWTAVAWGAGLLVLLGSYALSLGERRRLAAGARPVDDGHWLALLAELRGRLRIRRPVRLQVSGDASVPMTWGFRRPVILLPADAEAWPAKRRRDVLLHELAHVRRGDALTQAVARLACAAYWFHPLVWWAAHRLRVESEHACDDRVLNAGARASDYADNLLAAARALRGAVPAAAVAMARPSKLEGRIRAILDDRRDRSPLSPGRLLATLLLAGCLALPLAAAAPQSEPEAPEAPEAPPAPETPPAAPSAAEAPPAPEAMPSPSPAPEAPPAPEAVPRPGAPAALAAPVAPAAVPRPDPPPAPPSPAPPVLAAGSSGGHSVEVFDGPVEGFRERCGDGGLSESIHGRNGDYDIEIEVGRCRLAIKMRGEIEFTADETGIERMDRRAYLEIDERVGRDRRRIEIHPGPDGEPGYDWFVDRRRQSFDADAERWLEQALPTIFRATGIDAPARVGRILARSGPGGVLAEIPLLLGDHVQRVYLEELLEQADLGPGEIGNALRAAGREIGSDHELAELLIRISRQHLAAREPRMAYVEAAKSIGSDHELRRALRSLLDRDLSDEVLAAVLEAAAGIGSDHEMAELLIELVAKGLKPDAPFFAALASVGSDHEHGRVLGVTLERAAMTPELARRVLESSLTIGSDHEQAQVLVQLASSTTIGEELRPLFQRALDGVGSEHERERVQEAFWY